MKLKTEENRLAYAKQHNYCVKLLQQKKRQYFENLNLSSITDNKLFWKTVSPLFVEKKNGSKNNEVTLVEGGKVLTDDAKIADTFNSFCDTGDETDSLLRAIKKHRKPPSILRTKKHFKNSAKCSFVPVDKDVIAKEIKNLDTKKAAQQDDIPVKMLMLNDDIFS